MVPIAWLAVTLAAAAERPFYPYSDEQPFERGQMAEYAGENLDAVSFPVGGVGSGAIHIDGRGVRHGWMIFSPYWLCSNPADNESPVMTYRVSANQRMPLDKPTAMACYMSYVPDSYFAVRVAPCGGNPTVRVL